MNSLSLYGQTVAVLIDHINAWQFWYSLFLNWGYAW